jgi:type IV secretion system protein VirB1
MDFYALAAECAPWVAPQTMAAIVRTESSFQPLTIGVNGGAKLSRQPISKDEAVVTARWLINNHYNIDLGLGQVNSANLKKTGLRIEDAFDPCKNLAAAATILQQNYQSANQQGLQGQPALHAALSAYNTGSLTRGFANGYVQKVVNNADLQSPSTTVRPIALVPRPAKVAQKNAKHLIKNRPILDKSNAGTNTDMDQVQPDSSIMVYATRHSPSHGNAPTASLGDILFSQQDVNTTKKSAPVVEPATETIHTTQPVRLLASAIPAGDQTICAQDTIQCSDGSWVGRSIPKCDFACPTMPTINHIYQ